MLRGSRRVAVVTLCVVALVTLLLASFAEGGGVNNCQSVASGAFTSASTWTNCGGSYPGASDEASIGNAYTVTVGSTSNLQVYWIDVSDSGTLVVNGKLTTVGLEMENGKVVSSGQFNLLASDYSDEVGLDCEDSSIELSHSFSLVGPAPYFDLEGCRILVSGSVNVTATDDTSYPYVGFWDSEISVAHDFTITGGSTIGDDRRRGFPYDNALQAGACNIQIGGDLVVTSRDNTNTNATAVVDVSTAEAGLNYEGSRIVVGGDVVLQSGDSLYGSTGHLYLYAGNFWESLYENGDGSESIVDFVDDDESVLIIGGSLVMKSGSVTGLNKFYDGNEAGSVDLAIYKSVLAVNGSSSSSIRMQSGNGGAGYMTYGGGDTSYVSIALGFASTLVVNGDCSILSGLAGNGGNISSSSGEGGGVYLTEAFGAKMEVGGDFTMQAGNGGAGNIGGESGEAEVDMINGADLDVGGDMLLASGSGGKGTSAGGDSWSAGIFLGNFENDADFFRRMQARALNSRGRSLRSLRNGGGGADATTTTTTVSATEEKEESKSKSKSKSSTGKRGWEGYFVESGATTLSVAGNLDILSGNAADSFDSGYEGGECKAFLNSVFGPDVITGLVVDNVWKGEVNVGGHLRVTGCNGGGSLSQDGNDGTYAGVMVSGGVTLNVAGSVTLQGGNGGVTNGTNEWSAGNGQGFILAGLLDCAINIGSFSGKAGNGGNVYNNTAVPGNSYESGIIVAYNSQLSVGGGHGTVRLTGGRGGSTYSEDNPDSYAIGGYGNSVIVEVEDASVATMGDLIMNLPGNGDSRTSGLDDKKRSIESRKAKKSLFGLSAFKGVDKNDEDENVKKIMATRGEGSDTSGIFVTDRSLVTVNGRFDTTPATPETNTVNGPETTDGVSISVMYMSTVNLNEGGNVVANSAGTTLNADGYLDIGGGAAFIEVEYMSNLVTRDELYLTAGNGAKYGSTHGAAGFAAVYVSFQSTLDQFGFVSIKQGAGPTDLDDAGIDIDLQSSWNIYPCDGADLILSHLNSTNFAVTHLSAFNDCRGLGASTHYAPPALDVTSKSCAPCACSGVHSTCPAFSEDGASASTLSSLLVEGARLIF